MSIATMMRFTFYVGAAREDADPQQLARLRIEIPPLLEQLRIDGQTTPVINAVRQIMGLEWEPSGKWADAIGAI